MWALLGVLNCCLGDLALGGAGLLGGATNGPGTGATGTGCIGDNLFLVAASKSSSLFFLRQQRRNRNILICAFVDITAVNDDTIIGMLCSMLRKIDGMRRRRRDWRHIFFKKKRGGFQCGLH